MGQSSTMMNCKFLIYLSFTFLISPLCGMIVKPGEKWPADGIIELAPGIHELKHPFTVTSDTTIIFQPGAELTAKMNKMLILKNGNLTITATTVPGIIKNLSPETGTSVFAKIRNSVIDLNSITAADRPSLTLRNMKIFSHKAVDGNLRLASEPWTNEFGRVEKRIDSARGPIDFITIENCEFDGRGTIIGVRNCEIGELRITNCRFYEPDRAIYCASPMPRGAVVSDNTIIKPGRYGIVLSGGRSTHIAEHCTRDLPNAIVHGNRILGGGDRSTADDISIIAIHIYGHNVSVQNNIIRDFNRHGEPQQPYGQILRSKDGTLLKGKHISVKNDPHRRLAGSAIYVKANHSVISSNICKNSGWRSVIEVKTGGKEHYVAVTNNVIDGTSLAVNESYGFECHAGRSLWSGNIAAKMPYQAFVVRSGFENTFTNNLICDSNIGFGIWGTAQGKGEFIYGNRFINVRKHFADTDTAGTAALSGGEIYPLPPLPLPDGEFLPEPSEKYANRMFIMDNELYICVKNNSKWIWKKFISAPFEYKLPVPHGKELLKNPEQNPPSTTALHPDQWVLRMRTTTERNLSEQDAAENFSYDRDNFLSGKAALKMVWVKNSGNWILSRSVQCKEGGRFRFSAKIKAVEPSNITIAVADKKQRIWTKKAADTKDWQDVEVDFNAAPGERVVCRIICTKASNGKAVWIDRVSCKELK